MFGAAKRSLMEPSFTTDKVNILGYIPFIMNLVNALQDLRDSKEIDHKVF
jgi:hypothetical protein